MSGPVPNTLCLTPSLVGRRIGLCKKYRSASGSINASPSSDRDNMPKPTTKVSGKVGKVVNKTAEEDVNRPPISFSDSSEDEDNRADIRPTAFKSASQEPESKASKKNPVKNSKKPATVNGSKKTPPRASKGLETTSTRNNESGSPKRKSREDPPASSKDAPDMFGHIRTKKVKRGYGSSQPSSSAGSYGKSLKNYGKVKVPLPLPETPQKPKSRSIKVHDELESPNSNPKSLKKFQESEVPPEYKDSDSPRAQFKVPFSSGVDDEQPPYNSSPSIRKNTLGEDLAFTQLPKFQMVFDDFDEISGSAEAIIGNDRVNLPAISADDAEDDLFATLTQRARCPMCNKPVDPEDLREFGEMNTRQQEKFCHFHQKKTAQEDWEIKSYPEIDWDKLGSRISKHYSFIRNIINGSDSHFRDLLEERVNAGKDRNLLKMTSNLTPGYYGGRGLRVISENIMYEFTSLLKKNAVKDRRISSRGPTAFVQSVLVPEVTVLLIMEDMDVEIEEARNILEDSVGVGELIHEEIKEVVKTHVEESEEEEDSD